MRYLRFGLSLCAVAVTAMLGCDGGADEGANESTATSCAIESFDSAWWNQAFPGQIGMFHTEFSADVTSPNMDVVIGLSSGAATKWASLAAIVRFNPQGYFDARDGGTYRADAAVQYYANMRYYFRFDVDVRSHTYSVWIKAYESGDYIPLARNYAFRTEQASVARLNNVAAFVNPETSAQGAADICGFAAVVDDTTGDGCLASSAGGGFVNAVVVPSSTVSFVSFTAKAGQAGMDGVVGAALGDIDAYDDFAASIRFFTNGYIEARDGDQYRADRQIAYVAGQTYTFKLFLDLPSHTYSVYVAGEGVDPDQPTLDDYVRLASTYRFRPAQAQVATIDRVGSIVASASGRVDACKIAAGPHSRKNVVAMRDGWFDIATRSDGGVVIADTFTTMALDANNTPVATVAAGGQVAVDAAGNVTTAQVIDGRLFIRGFTPTLAPRWSGTSPIAGRALDLAATTTSDVVAVALTGAGPYDWQPRLLSLHDQGQQTSLVALPDDTTAIGLGASHAVLARTQASGAGLLVRTYDNLYSAGATRAIAGNYTVRRIAVAPDGSFVIAGTLGGPTDFGTGEITYFAPGGDSGVYWDWFVAGFSPDLTTKYAFRLTNEVMGMVTNGRETAISFNTRTQLYYTDYLVLDAAGNTLRSSSEDSIVGGFGDAGEIGLAESGRTYWNIGARFLGPVSNGFPFLFTIDP